MIIDVVDNRGVTNMAAEIAEQLQACSEAKLATASLTREGLTEVMQALEQRHMKKVRLLVGLYNGHTEPAALRRLLTLQKKNAESLEVRIARNSRFHWKLYVFRNKDRIVAYIGSSNLTKDGLGAEGEFNVRLSGTNRDTALSSVVEKFERSWKKDSFPLERRISDGFSPISARSRNIRNQIDPTIRELLRHVSSPSRRTKTQPTVEPTYYTFITDTAERATNQAVRHQTRWDQKHWQWIVFTRRAERDRVLKAGSFYLGQFHRKHRGVLSLNDVCDDDEFRTQDGRYLVAYRKRAASKAIILSDKVIGALRQGGVISRKTDLQRNRTLGEKSRQLLKNLVGLGDRQRDRAPTR